MILLEEKEERKAVAKKELEKEITLILGNEPYHEIKGLMNSIVCLDILKDSYSFTKVFVLRICKEKHVFMLRTKLKGELLQIQDGLCWYYYKQTFIQR